MKNNRSFFAVLGVVALIAVAILVAPISDSAKFSGIMGYGVVLALLTLGAMEYGSSSSSRDSSR